MVCKKAVYLAGLYGGRPGMIIRQYLCEGARGAHNTIHPRFNRRGCSADTSQPSAISVLRSALLS